jgi:hypothetical protein
MRTVRSYSAIHACVPSRLPRRFEDRYSALWIYQSRHRTTREGRPQKIQFSGWHSHNAYLISPKLFSILTTLTDYSARWRYRTLVSANLIDKAGRTRVVPFAGESKVECDPVRRSHHGPALSQKNPSFADPCLPRTVRIGVRRRPRSTTALPSGANLIDKAGRTRVVPFAGESKVECDPVRRSHHGIVC